MSTPTTTTSTPPTIAELVDLSGKTAIVTGGSMGIGRGIAERLHEAGADVVIADLDLPTGDAVATELNTKRLDSALALKTDVSQRADVEAMLAATVQRFGGLDILVNNAGIYPFAPFLEIDGELFEHVETGVGLFREHLGRRFDPFGRPALAVGEGALQR